MSAYPRIIAHRLGGALAPENTLPGLRIATRLGITGIEFDVMLSADGEPLVIHDETLERTTTGTGRVADHSAAMLRTLDAGVRHHKAFAGTAIPSFTEVMTLAARHGLWTNIEIKPSDGHEAATGRTVAARLGNAWPGPGIVSSFSRTALDAARHVAPDLPLALLYERLPAHWRDDMAALNAQAVHLAARHVDADVARSLSGQVWACYTVNEHTEAERLFALGCSAIFTDRPDLW